MKKIQTVDITMRRTQEKAGKKKLQRRINLIVIYLQSIHNFLLLQYKHSRVFGFPLYFNLNPTQARLTVAKEGLIQGTQSMTAEDLDINHLFLPAHS
jgi:hypothetical protein